MSVMKQVEKPGVDLLLKHFGTQLSERELEVGRLAVAGVATAEIAARLFLSVNTVKTHIRNILKKTRAANRNDLYRKLVESERAAEHYIVAPLTRADGPTEPQEFTALLATSPGPWAGILLQFDEFPLWSPRDLILPLVADLLTRSVRTGDRVAPWGDRILVMLPEANPTTVNQVKDRLVQSLQKWGSEAGFTLAIAAAVACTADGLSSSELLNTLQYQLQGVSLSMKAPAF